MPDKVKVIDELVEHIESALSVDSDYVDCVQTDLLQYTIALLKEQEATVKQWTKEIEDYQLAHAPDSHDKGEKYQYKKGIWDGLQIAWNIISEGR